ncbi:MAG: ABC transporter permease, partial [Halobaculum sp.]
RCRGSLAHPLGTTRGGADVFRWMVHGARTTVQFVLVTAALLAPLGIGVGVVAGYAGGRIDALLTGYVDVQQTVPTVVIYFLVTALTGPTLVALILVYGLFDWGAVARAVRSRTLEERQEAYVEAAESAGAGPVYTLRHHLVPNVASTAITAVSLALPKLVLIEVALSFVSLGGEGTRSWGQLLQRGLRFQLGSFAGGYSLSGNVRALWWVPVVPALATALVVLSASLVGDAVQSVTDPKGE